MKTKVRIISKIIRSRINKQPYKLNFAITSACNSRCKTCNAWQVFKKNPGVAKNDLGIWEIKLIFKNLPNNFVWLALSGGEPFLRKDLFQICQSAVENIPNLGLISIPSNGLLAEHIIKETKRILSLPLPNLFLNFSLDGPEPIHDEIRGIKGAYRITWNTYSRILELSKNNPQLNVNIETTISKYNLDYLEDFLAELITRGHKITATIAHTGYLYKNTSKNSEFTRINHHVEKLRRIIGIIKKSLSPISPLDIVQRIYLNNILEYYQAPKRQPLSCIALKSSLAIDAQGNITPCFMWGKILGNIRDYNYDLNNFLKKELGEINNIRNLIAEGKCPNCWTPCEAYQSIINKVLSPKPV